MEGDGMHRLPTALGKEREAREVLARAVALSVDQIRIAGADALPKVEEHLDRALDQATKILGAPAHVPDFAKLGAKGGKRTAETYGSRHFSDAGRIGGKARKDKIGTEGFAALGRKGGVAAREAREAKGGASS